MRDGTCVGLVFGGGRQRPSLGPTVSHGAPGTSLAAEFCRATFFGGHGRCRMFRQDRNRSISPSGTRVLGPLGVTVGLGWALQYSGTRLGGRCGYCSTRVLGWGVAVGTAVHGHQGYAVYTRVLGTHRGTGGYYACTRNPNPSQPTPHPLPSQKCSLGNPKEM